MFGKQGIFSHKTKMTTLFWLCMISIILTTGYSYIILRQGYKAKKMMTYIFKQVKRVQQSNNDSTSK